ncbi:dihydropyrimidinase [Phoenix dactylifera]|uniref:dihydropyrimidinase n=1 Tax=Phoenix dactylifera TaxID=42345 RepID=A0A8B7BZE9_PHODC|nr:dihydropyrimidinase [Phoenix dactylifera]
MAGELGVDLPWQTSRETKSILSISRSFVLDLFLLLLLLSIPRSISELNQMQGYCAVASDSECGWSLTKILIKGGTVVNAHHKEVADVYIEDGIIVSVRPNIKVGDDVKILDATGKYVMPGGIDPHTHLEMEFMGTVTIDDFFTGQAAALAGGTTMHIDFVIPVKGSLSAGLESYKNKAKKAVMDYGFHMAITKWDEEVAKEMELMVKENGINSFKFFMAYKGSLMVNDELLIQGLKKCKSLGALAMVHAENGDGVAEGQKRMIDLGIRGPEGHALSRPPVLEGEATARAIHLASFVNTPLYVVHVMSIDAMEEIAKARKAGQRVTGEPVVSGLVLDDSWLWDPDFTTAAKYVMSPPIRKAGHDKALQSALSRGILQLVGTDHCTFNSTQKAFGFDDFRKIPNGVNGIEERMHLIWDTMVVSGQISVTDYVRITSTECARIFNIYPRKGAILEGSDADIIILNPNASFKVAAASHHSRSDTNVYDGRTGKGKVEVTISGGRIVWEDGTLNIVPGSGRYVRMEPYGYLFDGVEKADAAYLASLRAPVLRAQAAA